MKNTNVLYGVIGFVLGLLIVSSFCYMNHHRGVVVSNNESHKMHRTMVGMMAKIDGKTGDEFDAAFIDEMIVHHEGAVAMAQAALVNAKHQEIKDMANAIISAQTSEIEQMKEWKQTWYSTN